MVAAGAHVDILVDILDDILDDIGDVDISSGVDIGERIAPRTAGVARRRDGQAH